MLVIGLKTMRSMAGLVALFLLSTPSSMAGPVLNIRPEVSEPTKGRQVLRETC